MKMRIGNRLLKAREDRKLNQVEMAELLGVSQPVYSRLERNEGVVNLEQVVSFSKTLEIPVQEFFPETLNISSNNTLNQNGYIGLVVGNIYNYSDKELSQALLNKDAEIQALKVKLASAERELENLKKINALLEGK